MKTKKTKKKTIIGLFLVIFVLSFICTFIYIHKEETKSDGTHTKETVVGIGFKLDMAAGKHTKDIEKLKDALSKMTNNELRDSIIALIKQNENERDEFRKMADEYKKAARIEDKEEREKKVAELNNKLDKFFNDNPSSYNEDYYKEKASKWFDEDLEQQVKDLTNDKNNIIAGIKKQHDRDMKILKSHLKQKDIEIDSLNRKLERAMREGYASRKEIENINDQLEKEKKERAKLVKQISDMSSLSIQDPNIYFLDKNEKILYPNRKGKYKTRSVKDIRVTFIPVSNSEHPQNYSIDIHCVFPTKVEPPVPFCDSCSINISKNNLNRRIEKQLIKECPRFRNYEFIDGEYRIRIKDDSNGKDLYPEKPFTLD
jgi:hypothetical protein